MNRPVRILSIIFFVIVILTVLLEVLAKIVFHDRIAAEIERVLDDNLASELTFSDVNISTIRNFPTATIIIDSVLIREQGYDILQANKILLRMNPFDLLEDDFIFTTVEIIGAKFQAPIDSTGQKYMIKGKPKPDKASRALHLHVPNILIRDAEVLIRNDYKKSRIKISVSRGVFKMISTNDLISFEGNATAVLDTMINKGNLVATRVKVAAQNASFRIGQVDKRNLLEGILKIEDAHVKVAGVLKPTANGNIMDITLEGDEADLNNYFTIMPQLSQVKLKQTNPDARLGFKMKVTGYVDPVSYPFIDVDFDLSDAAFAREGSDYQVREVSVKGKYSNGEDKLPETSSLLIESGTARIDSSFVLLHGSYTNFSDPYIDLKLESNLDLTELNALFDLPYVDHLRGNVKVHLDLEGKLSDRAKLGHVDNRKFSGRIEFMDVMGTMDSLGIELSHLNGWVSIKDENINFGKVRGSLNQSLFSLNGSILNFVPLLDSTSRKRTVAELTIDLQEFTLPKSKVQKNDVDKDLNFDYSFFPKKLDLILNFKSRKIDLGEIAIQKVKIGARLNKDSVMLNSFEFDFENGKILVEGKSRFKAGRGIEHVLYLDADFDYLNVNTLMSKFPVKKTPKKKFNVPNNLIVHTKIKVDKVDFDNKSYTDIDLLARYGYDTLQIKKMNLGFPLGQIKAQAQIVAVNTLPDIEGDIQVALIASEVEDLKAFYRSFIPASDSTKPSATVKKKNAPSYYFRDIRLHVTSPSISHQQVKVEDFDASLVLNDKNLDLKEAKFKIFDGELSLNALIERNDSLNLNLVAYLTARHLSAGAIADGLPAETQKLINSSNLDGRVNIDGMLLLTYDKNLIHQDKDFLGKIKIQFNEGKLMEFKPITESLKILSDKVTDTIHVANKDFNILFHNDEVIVPKTIFSSNITDIAFMGYHNKEINFGFDLKVSVSDFLFKSQKKKIAAVDDKKVMLKGINYYLSARTIDDELDIKTLKRKEYDWQYKLLHERYRQVNFMLDQRLDSIGHVSSPNEL